MAFFTTWDQQELAGAPTVDCKGMWNDVCNYPTPDFQNNFRITWKTPWNVRASLLWRHIDEVRDVDGVLDLDAIDYFDLAAIWDATENITVRIGANNILDEDPSLAGGSAGPSNNGNGNVFPGAYDALGRYVFGSFSLKL